MQGQIRRIVEINHKGDPLAADHGGNCNVIGIGSCTFRHRQSQRTAFFQIAAATGFRSVGYTQNSTILSVCAGKFQFIGNRTGRKLVILDPKCGFLSGITGFRFRGHTFFHPMELQLYIQGFLICQLIVVSNISFRNMYRKGKMVGFFIRTGSGIQNQRAAIQRQTSGFLAGSRSIGCADDLRVFCQRSGQLHRVAKYPFCQIVILYGKAFRFIRAANDLSNIAVIGLPGQFQIQVQHIFAFQDKLEG